MELHAIESILDALEGHEVQASRVLNLVPSENSTSALAKLPMLLDVYHRYFFNPDESPDNWSFRGSQDVAALEVAALQLLRELTGARHVNLRPLSGLAGMAMVLSAFGGGAGGRVMTVAPQQGGHYATASLAGRLGLQVCFIGGPDPHSVDFAQVAATLAEERPGLVYVDQSYCLFPLDVARLVAVVRRVAPQTIVHVDCSHWLGLVLGGEFPNPLAAGADSFGGSTHKTFPGPQKAIVATQRQDLAERLFQAQFEMISSHHFAAVLSLGIALLEFRDCGGALYATRVIENTRAFAHALAVRGLPPEAADRGYSRGHQLWIRTAPAGVDGRQASDRLYAAGLRVNVLSDLPGILPEPALRVGVHEATYHGLTADDMEELAGIFSDAVLARAPAERLAAGVAALRARRRPPFGFPADEPRLRSRVERLLSRVFPPAPAAGEAVESGARIPEGVGARTRP